jgi:heat shock protein HtpX
MTHDEVEGVLAHEVTHIANGDMVTMTLLQGVVNALVMFIARVVAYALASRGSRDDRGGAPSFLVVVVLQMVLGVIGMIIVAWFSRQREFRADHGGATLAGKADMLAALRRLGAGREVLIDPRHEALATMKISGKWTGLFSTHPPLEQRIAVLERAQIS